MLTLCLCEVTCFLFKVHQEEMDRGLDANDADANSLLLNRARLSRLGLLQGGNRTDLMHEAFFRFNPDKTTQHYVTLFLLSASTSLDYTSFHFFSSFGLSPLLFTPLGGVTTGSQEITHGMNELYVYEYYECPAANYRASIINP